MHLFRTFVRNLVCVESVCKAWDVLLHVAYVSDHNMVFYCCVPQLAMSCCMCTAFFLNHNLTCAVGFGLCFGVLCKAHFS